MNPDLLEALTALATACYFEARRCHPRLFVPMADKQLDDVTDEEHAVLLVAATADALVERLDDLRIALEAPPWDACCDPNNRPYQDAVSNLDDDIPY